jgi:hypothetical protein
MAFSVKQIIFANYLLEQIGFSNSQIMENYLNSLEVVYGKYYQDWKTSTNKNATPVIIMY